MNSKELNYATTLTSYSFRSITIRIIFVGLLGLLFLLFSLSFAQDSELNIYSIELIEYIRIIAAYIVCSECNVLLDNISEKYLPIPGKLKTRIMVHILMNAILISILFIYFRNVYNGTIDFINNPVSKLMLAFSLLFIIMIIVFGITVRITRKWLDSERENNSLKRAKLKSDYNSLQDQLNPHFLFNNLSVLKSMIMYNQKAAESFTQNFTDVYRYVLQSRDRTTVQLIDELEFIESYIGLHKERLGERLSVKMSIENGHLNQQLPPLSLQLLVENAIKHNIASKSLPLQIDIYTKSNNIVVANNYNPKESTYSTKKGMKNLKMRYKLLTQKEVIITQNSNFIVELPLL